MRGTSSSAEMDARVARHAETCPASAHQDSAAALTETPDIEFERAYDEHFALVWRALWRLGTPEANLEDATQDVFLVVYRRRHEFSQLSAWKTWIYGIAVRVAKDHRRAELRHRRRVAEFARGSLPAQPTHASPGELAEQHQAALLVLKLLAQLPEQLSQVLVLVELEQLSVSETAKVLELGLRTAQRRLSQARAVFEDLLNRYAEGNYDAPNSVAPKAVP